MGVCEGSNASLYGIILSTVIKRDLPLAVIVNKVRRKVVLVGMGYMKGQIVKK